MMNTLFLVGLFIGTGLAGGQGETPYPLQLTQTIPLGGVEGRIDHMALDPDAHRLYVAALGNNTVEVIDLQAGKRIYVSGGEGFVMVLEQNDSGHYAVSAEIPTAPGARTSYFDAASERLYVAVPHRGKQRAEIRVFKVLL